MEDQREPDINEAIEAIEANTHEANNEFDATTLHPIDGLASSPFAKL